MNEETNTKSIAAPEWLDAEKRAFLQQIEPVIRRSVYKAIFYGWLTIMGVCLGLFILGEIGYHLITGH